MQFKRIALLGFKHWRLELNSLSLLSILTADPNSKVSRLELDQINCFKYNFLRLHLYFYLTLIRTYLFCFKCNFRVQAQLTSIQFWNHRSCKRFNWTFAKDVRKFCQACAYHCCRQKSTTVPKHSIWITSSSIVSLSFKSEKDVIFFGERKLEYDRVTKKIYPYTKFVIASFLSFVKNLSDMISCGRGKV